MKRFSWIVSVLFIVGLNAGIIWNALFNQPEPPKQLAKASKEITSPKTVPARVQQKKDVKTVRDVSIDTLVYKTQIQLKKQGIYKSKADGVYGAATRIAIARYQRVAGLKIDGKPSKYLLNHMFISANSLGEKIAKQKPQQISTINDSGLTNPVKRVQIGLEELGYNPGPTDGLMGGQTREAIRQFEKDNKLEITGKISDALLKKLLKVTGTSSLNNT